MRKSKTLARLRRGLTVRMCSLGHFIPAYVKLAAHNGFDCIWLDLEHRSIGDREVESLLVASHLHDVDVMIRPPTLEKSRLYRYLEDGATGLMIPHVNSADKAKMLVDAVKFPPLGGRGLDGAGLDADYLTVPAEQYVKHANSETFLVVQIETPEAVEHVEEIASVDGVDGLFVGPGDLGLRLKHSAAVMDLESAFEHVASACRKAKKPWGTPVGSPEELQRRREQGGQLLAHGGDFRALAAMLKQYAAAYEQD